MFTFPIHLTSGRIVHARGLSHYAVQLWCMANAASQWGAACSYVGAACEDVADAVDVPAPKGVVELAQEHGRTIRRRALEEAIEACNDMIAKSVRLRSWGIGEEIGGDACVSEIRRLLGEVQP